MLIKKSASRFELKSYLKKKSVLFFIIFFLNSLFFTFLGVYAYKSGFASKVNRIFTYDNNYRLNVVKNFVRKPFIKVDKIYLDINSLSTELNRTYSGVNIKFLNKQALG